MTTNLDGKLAALLLLCGACASSGGGGTTATREFDVRHELRVKVPENTKKLRVWFAVPQKDDAQQVSDLKIDCPYPTRRERDSEGNETIYLEVNAPDKREFTIVEEFKLSRSEVKSGVDAKKARPLTDAERTELARYLQPNQNVVIDDQIKALSRQIVGDETNPVNAARKIYDWELANVEYWVKDPKNKKASPVGSTSYCLENKTGNCTDFHSLWASLARASGIPTRIVYGSFLKAELDGQDVDQSYHCWPLFYAGGIGWVPHDVAVADIFVGAYPVNADNETLVRRTTADGYKGPDAAKVDYYFGNLDERRVTWSTGRDLMLTPGQAGGPVNALPKAYVEADGKIVPEGKAEAPSSWTRKLTFREKKAS